VNEPTSPELFLARRAAAGHAGSWEAIVDSIGDGLWSIARQFGGDDTAAEDLMQEMFLRLWRMLPKYRGDVPLRSWCFAMSRNLCIDLWRRRRGERESLILGEDHLAFLAASDDPRREAERREVGRALDTALHELPDVLAEAVILCDLEEWTMAEVAAALAVPIGTIKSRLHRGRARLAEALDSWRHLLPTQDEAQL
jgi:RNA polymerase sigma-70 factor (ECF subfamily)